MKNQIIKVVLTGGPCAGKTTILKNLADSFSDKIAIVPEAATELFNSGYPYPKKRTQEWLDSFQGIVVSKQYELERKALKFALKSNISLVVCDRGILDGSAYLVGGVEEFCRSFKINKEKVLSRYNNVIHLESLAKINPKLYRELKSTNPHRTESVFEAKKFENNIKKAWKDHNSYLCLSGNIEENSAQIIKIIKNCLES